MRFSAEENRILENTIQYVKNTLNEAEGGHDWFHIERVYKNALHILEKEEANALVVALAALLHDIADYKFHGGDDRLGPHLTREFLDTQDIPEKDKEHIVQIVANVSFKGGNFKRDFHSKELEIVQDADRLDAIGAIGIARTFNYGGYKNRKLYDPEISPNLTMTPEEYKASKAPTINHFYEKLLLLKEGMHTQTGKQIAQRRHEFMEEFLKRFYAEWEGRA